MSTSGALFQRMFALALTGCWACTGVIGGQSEGSPSSRGGPGASSGAGDSPTNPDGSEVLSTFSCDPDQHDPGPSPLKRLTPTQYENSVRLVFGDSIDVSPAFPGSSAHTYIGLVQPDVSQFDVESYHAAAAIVAQAVGDGADELAPCATQDDATGAEACIRSFLATYGRLAFRSLPSEADLTRLLSVFAVGFDTGGYAHGLSLMVEAMLDAPRFLYRPELGDAGAASSPGAVPLSGYELASRLSFAFWNSGPDAELLALAESGELSTDAGLEAAAERVMSDARADASFREFLYAWFGISDLDYVSKDREVFPDWQDDTANQMRQQSDAFFDSILFGENGTLGALFSAPVDAFASDALLGWYQGRPAGTSNGILTLPALLSVHSKPRESFPIYRGVFVRENLLCQPLPPPPPDVPPPPTPTEGVSARERFSEHSSNSACKGCHALIDPIGFAFENYDGVGRYRSEADGAPIDSGGELFETDTDGPFASIAELSDRLSQSQQVRACAARQWFRYVMARFEQDEVDGCSMAGLMADFEASDYRLASLRTSIVKSEAFRSRRPIDLAEPNP